MKKIIILLLSIILFSCQENNKKSIDLISKTKSKNNQLDYGNLETDKRYNYFKKHILIINDSLIGKKFLNQKMNPIDCKITFIGKNDFNNKKENYFIREYEIAFLDTLKINILQKQNKLPEYIYLYKNKPFKIKNYYGEMYGLNSSIFFSFTNRQCYKISSTKFLMREQPSTWCGLANQFDFFQIFDLQKMEIIQFVDKDEKLK